MPTVVGQGGRVPPTSVIEDDATGSVETSGVFDPASDGIDFYESMEAMLLQVNNPVVTGPRNGFGEVWVLADDGAGDSRARREEASSSGRPTSTLSGSSSRTTSFWRDARGERR